MFEKKFIFIVKYWNVHQIETETTSWKKVGLVWKWNWQFLMNYNVLSSGVQI